MIRFCGCDHKFQDKEHGQNQRVHNPTKDTPTQYRCTVCGTVKGSTAKPVKK